MYKSRQVLMDEIAELNEVISNKDAEIEKIVGIKHSYNQENKRLKQQLHKQKDVDVLRLQDIENRANDLKVAKANIKLLERDISEMRGAEGNRRAKLNDWVKKLDAVFNFDNTYLPTYTVKEGKHRFKPFNFKFTRNFSILKYSAVFESVEVSQHWNKLWGLSFGLNHHKNSIRIGFRRTNKLSTEVELCIYSYVDGVRNIVNIGTMSMGTKFEVQLRNHLDYISVVVRTGTSAIEEKVEFNKRIRYAHLLRPYFGGTSAATKVNTIRGQVDMLKSYESRLHSFLIDRNLHFLYFIGFLAALFAIGGISELNQALAIAIASIGVGAFLWKVIPILLEIFIGNVEDDNV